METIHKIGRRKTSVARIYLKKGKGNFTINTKDWKQIRENPLKPLINKTISGLYSPGSTLKPLVALSALEIDGGTDIGADLTTSDLIVVDDGAGGTNRKAALSRVVTLMTAQGFSQEDPTALAIALG